MKYFIEALTVLIALMSCYVMIGQNERITRLEKQVVELEIKADELNRSDRLMRTDLDILFYGFPEVQD